MARAMLCYTHRSVYHAVVFVPLVEVMGFVVPMSSLSGRSLGGATITLLSARGGAYQFVLWQRALVVFLVEISMRLVTTFPRDAYVEQTNPLVRWRFLGQVADATPYV